MKNKTVVAIVAAFVATYTFPAMGADVVVGRIYDVAMKNGKIAALFIAAENQDGQIITVSCETASAIECKAAPGTKLERGEKVKIEKTHDFVIVQRISSGSNSP